jgi:hypothetical protein
MPDYPRLLNLDEIAEQRLIAYLDSELRQHEGERSDYVNRLIDEQKDYWAEPSTEIVTFPFSGAATIIIPLQAITIEATHSRTMTTLFALDQFTTVRAKHASYAKDTRPLERLFDHVLLDDIKIYNPLNDCILELEKFGTGIARVGHKKVVKTAIREVQQEDGSVKDEEFEVVTKNGPEVQAIPCSRFLMPFFYQTIEDSPWVGEEMSAAPHEIKAMEESGMFKEGTYEKIYGHTEQTPDKFKENQEDLEKKKPVPTSLQPIKWSRLWLSFDVARSKDIIREYGDAGYTVPDGKDREIVVDYHMESQTLMSIRYNWHYDLRRPYYKGVYFPVEHRWDGIGICKQLRQFQQEVTTQHRQRLDNATLANVRMIKVNKFSGYGPNEPIFPGKMWFLDKMDDVETFQLGEIYPSAYSNEHQTLQYAQQRSGVNELNLGMPQVGTPGTATAELSRVQESNKKYDFVYGNIRRFAGEIVIDVAAQLQQFGPKQLSYFDEVDDGPLVKRFLELPSTLIKEGIIVDIAVAGQKENKLLDRQNWTQLGQQLNMYYTSILQIAMQTGDKEKIALITQQAYEGATEAMRQILESYDIKNIDRLIVQELLTNGITQPQTGTPTTPGVSGAGAPQGIPQLALPIG